MVGLTPNDKHEIPMKSSNDIQLRSTIRYILGYLYIYRIDAAELRPFPPPLPSAVLTIGGVRHTFVDAAVFDIIFRSPIL